MHYPQLVLHSQTIFCVWVREKQSGHTRLIHNIIEECSKKKFALLPDKMTRQEDQKHIFMALQGPLDHIWTSNRLL